MIEPGLYELIFMKFFNERICTDDDTNLHSANDKYSPARS